jgi:hypothetical protein
VNTGKDTTMPPRTINGFINLTAVAAATGLMLAGDFDSYWEYALTIVFFWVSMRVIVRILSTEDDEPS